MSRVYITDFSKTDLTLIKRMCYGCNFRYFKEGGHKDSYSSFQSQLHIVFQPVKRNIPVESYLDTCESKEWKERVCLDDIKQVLEKSTNKDWFQRLQDREITHFMERLQWLMLQVCCEYSEDVSEYIQCAKLLHTTLTCWAPESYFPQDFSNSFLLLHSERTIKEINISIPVVTNVSELKEAIMCIFLMDLSDSYDRNSKTLDKVLVKEHLLDFLSNGASPYAKVFAQVYNRQYLLTVNSDNWPDPEDSIIWRLLFSDHPKIKERMIQQRAIVFDVLQDKGISRDIIEYVVNPFL